MSCIGELDVRPHHRAAASAIAASTRRDGRAEPPRRLSCKRSRSCSARSSRALCAMASDGDRDANMGFTGGAHRLPLLRRSSTATVSRRLPSPMNDRRATERSHVRGGLQVSATSMEGPDWFSSFPAADGRPLLLSAQVTPALGTGAGPFPVTTVPTEWLFQIDTAVQRSYSVYQ